MQSLFTLAVGLVMILPCVDDYHEIDLRTISYDVPSQEVSGAAEFCAKKKKLVCTLSAANARLGDCGRRCCCLLSVYLPHARTRVYTINIAHFKM